MTEEETEQPERRGGWLFWKVLLSIFLYFGVFCVLAGVAVGVVAFLVYDHAMQPGQPGAPITVAVPQGATGMDVGELLAEEGLISNPQFFRVALKLDNSGESIQHGIYDLPKGLSAAQLLDLLQQGPARHENTNQYKLTIPEGLAIDQMREFFDDKEAFDAAVRDEELIARLGLDVETLEGFLMPNTYYFDDKPTPREAVERMVTQFEEDYARLVSEIPGAEDYDKLAIVTAASLIEEEARVPHERPLVAAVLYNRIDKNMRLQMDATLAYLTGKFGERILNQDKEVDSPYNTYMYAGLPPGPISNPGYASLEAALSPAPEDYLYFVSNADGQTHTFSRTASEHERAVAKYRREIAAQRRAEGE